MDAVGSGQFTALQAVIDIHGVFFLVTLFIGFLNATPRGGEIVGNGKSNHRAVGEVHWALYKTLAKGTAPDDKTTVVILNGARDNFCR